MHLCFFRNPLKIFRYKKLSSTLSVISNISHFTNMTGSIICHFSHHIMFQLISILGMGYTQEYHQLVIGSLFLTPFLSMTGLHSFFTTFFYHKKKNCINGRYVQGYPNHSTIIQSSIASQETIQLDQGYIVFTCYNSQISTK